MRTRLSICRKKQAYQSEAEALHAIQRSGLQLHVYRCDRCRQIHLTSRTKGRQPSRPALSYTHGSMPNPSDAT